MRDVLALCDALFPAGHDARLEGGRVVGTGRTRDTEVAVVGTHAHAAIGADLAFALAGDVLAIMEDHPGRPILMLVDTQGQNLSRRDEMLGNPGYLAHLAKCFEVARRRGHRILALVYGEAVSGGFLALGMTADEAYATPDAQVRVMALPAMSRITQIPVERLEELCRTSPIFGPGAQNYEKLGCLEAVWHGDLAEALAAALARPARGDRRRSLGAERGGRLAANDVVERLLREP
ncbi:MAG: biotin-independent malonate decarboxylase subunit gamma [Betaproteobacteria bacterium]|nr:biotin-independent malonate decarboxylase subunit gamma [Betaproteobacteria bacterium]